MNIDVQGMRTVQRMMGADMLSIFILPPSAEVWEERLRARGTNTEEDIQTRLREGREEMKCASEYEYSVVNEILEVAAGQVSSILSEARVV